MSAYLQTVHRGTLAACGWWISAEIGAGGEVEPCARADQPILEPPPPQEQRVAAAPEATVDSPATDCTFGEAAAQDAAVDPIEEPDREEHPASRAHGNPGVEHTVVGEAPVDAPRLAEPHESPAVHLDDHAALRIVLDQAGERETGEALDSVPGEALVEVSPGEAPAVDGAMAASASASAMVMRLIAVATALDHRAIRGCGLQSRGR